jgi:urate oxidase
MGEAVLNRRVRDEDEGEIFHASAEPYGLIEGTVQRQG